MIQLSNDESGELKDEHDTDVQNSPVRLCFWKSKVQKEFIKEKKKKKRKENHYFFMTNINKIMAGDKSNTKQETKAYL